MMIAIRNATGLDLYLAVSAGERSIRLRVILDPSDLEEGEAVERLRPGGGHGIMGCPEGLGARVDVSRTGLAIRVARRREIIDHLDEDGEIDGPETYLEFTLKLLN